MGQSQSIAANSYLITCRVTSSLVSFPSIFKEESFPFLAGKKENLPYYDQRLKLTFFKLFHGPCFIKLSPNLDLRIMLLEFLFGLIFLGENFAFQFAVGLNKKTEIRTNDSLDSSYLSQDIVQSLDFDIENNLLMGGDKHKNIFIISIDTSIYREKTMEKDCSESVISINKTHLVAGCDKSIIFFNKSDLDKYDEILSDDFGSDQGDITIFDLENQKHLKNGNIANKILDIDALERDFVVSQCNQKCICSFEINQTNYLVEKKKLQFDKEIKVVFGGDTFLYLWILHNSSKLSFVVNEKVWGLDVFSSLIIASGHEKRGELYFSSNVVLNVYCMESLTNFSISNSSLDIDFNMNSQFSPNLLTEIESTSIYQKMTTKKSSDTLDISTESVSLGNLA
ncbi:hypothetical protein BpHYR1_042299 [Brachionus plicatilis]|uniref:Uncharacterized protein n=1 Tax=Brachionus plicatilis TaxID=10195 RepID=A0A3M7RTN6_BRAPC|nr:hypothetical protein BpHYR1_042299 [Brachionus plicatilis]